MAKPTDDTTRLVPDGEPPRRRVLVVVGNGRVRRVDLPERGVIEIGRDPSCAVVLDDSAVSKRHARLELDDTRVTLTDLGSKNGTRVGGNRITKPATLETGHVFEVGPATLVIKHVQQQPREQDDDADMSVFVDPAMTAVLALVDQVAPSDLSVVLQGETGTGKEVLASLVHARSPRKSKPLVRINCAALPLTLLEAELFGSEAGAFTGATGERRGLLEEANGGTVFLDEIGELPLEAQAKVLRALEDGAFFRVGGRKAVKVDVRFVAATNRDLAASVREGTFRADLYYRLNGITLHVPPLRARPAEVLPLAGLFMRRAALAAGLAGSPVLSSNAERRLFAYDWPGNVRELKNTMQRAVLLAGGDTIREDHLLLGEVMGAGAGGLATIPPPPSSLGSDAAAGPAIDLRSELDRRERERIDEALRACGGNQTRAAEMLGISRRTLVSRLEKHKFARPLKK